MKKGIFSKIIVTFIILSNTFFTVAFLYVFLKTQTEPIALISAWFSFTTVELWHLAVIKNKKTEGGKTKDEAE